MGLAGSPGRFAPDELAEFLVPLSRPEKSVELGLPRVGFQLWRVVPTSVWLELDRLWGCLLVGVVRIVHRG